MLVCQIYNLTNSKTRDRENRGERRKKKKKKERRKTTTITTTTKVESPIEPGETAGRDLHSV